MIVFTSFIIQLETDDNKLHWTKCHSGFNFTDFSTQNNGLYEAYADTGSQRATKIEADRALFKVPTLRDIGLTAPYMHDGSMGTLEGVITHYESRGKSHINKPCDCRIQI